MTGGEKALVVGAVGLGILAFLKSRSAASALPPNLSGPSTLTPTFTDLGPGAGILAPIYNVTKPLAPVIQKPLAVINNRIGGFNPYGKLTRNSDGSYTDSAGCKITFLPNGTMHRDCGSIGNQFTHSNTYKAGKTVVHALSTAYKDTLGRIF